MQDIPQAHRWGDELLHKLVRMLVKTYLPKHPDGRHALEIVRLDQKRDKYFSAK